MREQNPGGWAGGGSALLINPNFHYKLILKEINVAHELIAVRVHDTTIIGLYIRVDSYIRDYIRQYMDKIQFLSRGTRIVLGYMN